MIIKEWFYEKVIKSSKNTKCDNDYKNGFMKKLLILLNVIIHRFFFYQNRFINECARKN